VLGVLSGGQASLTVSRRFPSHQLPQQIGSGQDMVIDSPREIENTAFLKALHKDFIYGFAKILLCFLNGLTKIYHVFFCLSPGMLPPLVLYVPSTEPTPIMHAYKSPN
jgi:hypothetical protein